ncbi:hypothetical protein [Streptomyces carpaticus]|uniref:Alanine-rich protein n=1 Tax=Streptomyces carpaticus TaxID=285558 RepID=A0ABV4ZMB8_9ACTN
MLRTSAFLYPWDVNGDPAAAELVAGLGVQQVTLASAYHATRALTPRHPERRIVTARHSAVYYPADPAHWADSVLRPAAQTWLPGEDPYGEAAAALAAAGLDVHSWVILAHNSRLGREHPESTVRNVHGDHYPWAPCIARPEVRAYAVRLAAEAAVRPGTTGTELESCGWYGLEHPHAHDKIAGAPLGGYGRWLLSLCFCAVCEEGYAEHGADPRRLRARVRDLLAPAWEGRPVEGELTGEEAAAVAGWRAAAADTFQRQTVAAVRERARERGLPGFRVLLHAHPGALALGANAGADPARVLDHADGVVLPCTGDDAARDEVLPPYAAHRRPHTVLAANFQIVAGMGGSPGTLVDDAAHAASLGATELRLYHAGLATADDLALVRHALDRLP